MAMVLLSAPWVGVRQQPSAVLKDGRHLIAEGNYGEAARVFQAASPDDYDSSCELAYCFFRLDNMPRAVAETERVLAERPHHPRALYIRGMLLKKQGQLAAALDQFRLALRHGEPLAAHQVRIILDRIQ